MCASIDKMERFIPTEEEITTYDTGDYFYCPDCGKYFVGRHDYKGDFYFAEI